jgi:tRNA G18 (ribose-2'-O)-methylase SpoU
MVEDHPFGERCPVCLGETREISKHLLPIHQGNRPKELNNPGIKTAMLDNIRSAWNVGSIFRTAGGLGIEKLYLCGITPTPESEAVRKTSLKTEDQLSWEYTSNALETVKQLRDAGHILIALEQDTRAIPLTQGSIPKSQNPVLILGNEVTGIDPAILDICDHIVYIPMRGGKESFNVGIAFGIAAYTL